jgi:hypothetical protein
MYRRLVLLTLICLAAGELWAGCGFSWDVGSGVFPGITSDGFVQLWVEGGKLKVAPNVTVPLWLCFESKFTGPGVIGSGWKVPLIDSTIVQTDENTFRLILPDRQTVSLRRESRTPNVLDGGSWKGTISGSNITVQTACGWKITYTAGKISSFDGSSGEHLSFLYEQGQCSAIRANGGNILHIERASAKDDTQIALVFDGAPEKTLLTLEPRALLASVKGQFLITGMAQAVTAINTAQGEKYRCEYKPDLGGREEMTYVEGEGEPRRFTWSAPSGRVQWADGFRYQVDVGLLAKSGFGIERTAEGGKISELNSWDPETGVRKLRDSSGNLTTSYLFMSGAMKGQVRKVTRTTPDGKESVQESRRYDDLGRLIGLQTAGSSAQIRSLEKSKGLELSLANADQQLTATFDEKSNLSTLRVNGKQYVVLSVNADAVMLRDAVAGVSFPLPRAVCEPLIALKLK